MRFQWFILFVFASTVQGLAAAFQNLDFESANLPDLPPGEPGGFVRTSDALPGWTAFLGSKEQTQVLHNLVTFGSSAIGIHDLNSMYKNLIIEGDHSVLLQALLDPMDTTKSLDVSLQQTGLVPDNAMSIQFKASSSFWTPLPLALQVNNVNVPLNILANQTDYLLLAGDVSLWAGNEVELRFTATAFNNVGLDSISFSPEPIPEPTTWALLGLAVLSLTCLGRRVSP